MTQLPLLKPGRMICMTGVQQSTTTSCSEGTGKQGGKKALPSTSRKEQSVYSCPWRMAMRSRKTTGWELVNKAIKEALWLLSTTGHLIKHSLRWGSLFPPAAGGTSNEWSHLHPPDICWKSITVSCRLSRRLLKCFEGNFLSQQAASPGGGYNAGPVAHQHKWTDW